MTAGDVISIAIASLAGSIGLVVLYKQRTWDRTFQILQKTKEYDATLVNRDDFNVPTSLDANEDAIAITGVVSSESNQQPLISLNNSKLVARRRLRREITYKLRVMGRPGNRVLTPAVEKQLKTDTIEEIPWSLRSASATGADNQLPTVRVQSGCTSRYIYSNFGGRPALTNGMPTAMVSGGEEIEKVLPAGIATRLGWIVLGILDKNLETIDEGIQLGAMVTVVGKLRKGLHGTPVIQAHPKIGMFVVDDLQNLVSYTYERARSCKRWAIGLLSAGFGGLFYHIYWHRTYYKQLLRHYLFENIPRPSNDDWNFDCRRSSVANFSASNNVPRHARIDPNQDSLADNQDDECIVCRTNKRSVICQPCNHLCVCNDCALRIAADPVVATNVRSRCPLCRSPCTAFARIFLS